MNRNTVTVVFFVILGFGRLSADGADVVYTEGYVDIKYRSGEIIEALIGDFMETGDTIITGEDGSAELEKEAGSTIKIASDTIFTIREVEYQGEKRTVLSTTLGAVRYRLDKIAGKEPLFATPGIIAGVRGTEFEIFAGSDGATLIVVDSGAVVVESQGTSVELFQEEAVEVKSGQPPGEKFTVLRGQLDYSTWNETRSAGILEDPLSAVDELGRGMNALLDKIRELSPVFENRNALLEQERKDLRKLAEEKGKAAQKERYETVVFPLEIETSYLRLNLRYYALSALSFRRFVLTNMYLQVKSANLKDLSSPEYREFSDRYGQILANYEKTVAPLLVEADI